jgi:hypothetical protein
MLDSCVCFFFGGGVPPCLWAWPWPRRIFLIFKDDNFLETVNVDCIAPQFRGTDRFPDIHSAPGIVSTTDCPRTIVPLCRLEICTNFLINVSQYVHTPRLFRDNSLCNRDTEDGNTCIAWIACIYIYKNYIKKISM